MEERTLLLERLHLALVASIERANPNYLREPFRIAEIYEDLIPYRTHRDLIGVAMNGDYEDGLMRILAGEGDYLILGSPEVQRALVDELEKKHPDSGLFKSYGDEEVRLNPEALGMTPPTRPTKSVVRLFQADAPSGSGAPEGRWGLGNGPAGDGESRGGKQDAPSRAAAGGQAGADVPRPPLEPGRGTEAMGSGEDQVGSSQKFWMDAAPPAAPVKRETPSPSGVDKTGRLEAENRRLKILLAERVLEVEELRERLGGEGAEAHHRES